MRDNQSTESKHTDRRKNIVSTKSNSDKIKELEERVVELVRIADKLYEENSRMKEMLDSIGLQRSIMAQSKLNKNKI
jgi:hypothetical protein